MERNYIKKQDTIYIDNVKNIDKIEYINDYTIKMYLLEPLGMNHTCYNPTTDNVSRNGIGTNIIEYINLY